MTLAQPSSVLLLAKARFTALQISAQTTARTLTNVTSPAAFVRLATMKVTTTLVAADDASRL
jgi:hypothetical protein